MYNSYTFKKEYENKLKTEKKFNKNNSLLN